MKPMLGVIKGDIIDNGNILLKEDIERRYIYILYLYLVTTNIFYRFIELYVLVDDAAVVVS